MSDTLRVGKANRPTRRQAADSRSNAVGNSASVSSLVRGLNHRSWEVRDQAARQLIGVDVAFARIAARSLLTDPHWALRSTAAEVLGQVGNRSDVSRLAGLCDDPEWVVRASVAGSLGQLGGHKAVDILTGMLNDSDANVRAYAAVALGDLRYTEALVLIESKLEKESDASARGGLLQAAYSLGHRWHLPALLDLLNHADSQIRCQTLSGLWRDVALEDQPAVVEAARKVLQTERSPAVRDYAEQLVRRLTERPTMQR